MKERTIRRDIKSFGDGGMTAFRLRIETEHVLSNWFLEEELIYLICHNILGRWKRKEEEKKI